MYKFDDNKRTVDFILIYDTTSSENGKLYREFYLKNLKNEGLQYELNTVEHYYKIFIPRDTLYRICDALQVKLPIKDVSN